MRHAKPEDLDRLEALLGELRKLAGLKEKSRGTFYRGSRAFLHFHEHDGGLFADARFADDFERFAVTTVAERKRFLGAVKRVLNRAVTR